MYGWNVNVTFGPRHTETKKHLLPRTGLFAGTLIAGKAGWQVVEEINVGDLVWTFDSGLQPVKAIKRTLISAWNFSRGIPFVVPPGALGNEHQLLFMSGTGLLLECENAHNARGGPFVVLPIDSLDGLLGIARGSDPAQTVLISLEFDCEEAVYIDSGLLLHCPLRNQIGNATEPRYQIKSVDIAKSFLTDLDLAELALREPNDDLFSRVLSDDTSGAVLPA